MDALMAALVAALLIHASDRTAWLAARLGGRAAAVLGIVVTVTAGNALAAVAGALLAPEFAPNARDLLLAVALLAAGIGAFWPLQAPPPARLGGFAGGVVGAGLLVPGDRTLFVTLALAARAGTPALAAVGASVGAAVILVAAASLGEHGRRRLPVTVLRAGIGGALTLAGTLQGLAALRLI